MRRTNLAGQTFGRLTATERGYTLKDGHFSYECICECGKTVQVSDTHLKQGHTRSCGCLHIDTITVHGQSKTKEFESWRHMINRCYNKKDDSYEYYGGRGITVCERWLKSFDDFLTDMGRAPAQKLSIERIENNGNYEPGNCRWATSMEQCRNRRSNRWIEFNGEKKIITDWEKELGLHSGDLNKKLKKKPFESIVMYYKNKKTA